MRLALENRSRVWGFLMGLAKDPDRAEDLFQNTYLVICEKWRQYRPGTSFIAWALQIARYEFLASVDPARRPFVTVEMEALESAAVAGMRAKLDGASESPAARREALGRCVKEMAGKGRRAIELRYGRGLSCDAVAERLRTSLNALYSLLSRVRKALQECVERRLRVEEAR